MAPITVLQRQTVSKRAVPPVAARVRSSGVRWSLRELSGPSREGAVERRARASPDGGWGQRAYASERPARILRGPAQPVMSTRRLLARQSVAPMRRLGLAGRRRPHAGELRWVGIIRQAVRRSARRARAPLGGAASRRGRVRRLLRNPWLYVTIASLVGLAVAVSGLGGSALPLSTVPRPLLPAAPNPDPALYDVVLPDRPAAPAPFGTAPTIASLKVSSYRTRTGDTLSRIASRFHLNIDTVVSWNGIRDGRSLPTGTDLSIPNADGLKYVVRRGDTLEGISRTWGVDFNGLLDWNRLASSVIPVGQELFLPGARMSPTELNRILGELLLFPVQGRISSYFGERPDPFTGVANFHNGVDIVNQPGTPVHAAMAGTVADVGFNYNYGNYVILRHPGQYQTLYGHLIRSLVARGQKVQQGDTIGDLGTTGYSTGPHLHFSVFYSGRPVDPMRFLK